MSDDELIKFETRRVPTSSTDSSRTRALELAQAAETREFIVADTDVVIARARKYADFLNYIDPPAKRAANPQPKRKRK